ncbi:isatin hydrolase-like isoform X2 [Penaeus japonicus]|uniref:isatin hydrolase-like isoform X2 n=1 Tax=Penaeus japonicus TaxID=27405 RepID=UPI001C716EA8|nr:isatin hydrolase-like isoform X2 [Penaeus japonicus]
MNLFQCHGSLKLGEVLSNGNRRLLAFLAKASTIHKRYESNNICLAEHTGTHLDAPAHFFKDRWHVDEIPLSHLIGPGVVLDIQDKVKDNPLAELTVSDITSWTDANGPLPDGVIVFVLTGWGSRYGNKSAYFGPNSSGGSNLTFPGISVDAAKHLTAYYNDTGRRVVGVGLDTPSVDNGASVTFPTHVELFEHNVYGLENVANLEMLPGKGFQVTVMPMKIREGSGGPARIFATIPGADDAGCASATAHTSARSSAVTYLAPVLFILIAIVLIVTI